MRQLLVRRSLAAEAAGRGAYNGPNWTLRGTWSAGTNCLLTDGTINANNYIVNNQYGSGHPEGCTVLFCDASVHFITNTVNAVVLRSLASRDGNETIPAGGF